jgi:purine-binding chemotaxis protein CheW
MSSATSDAARSRQLVVFSLHNEEYALPIEGVHEIIRHTTPRSVASSDASVRGVISLRGRILPVLDLATRMGLGASVAGDDSKIVIVESGDEMAGLVVDNVEEVLTIEESQIDESPIATGSSCIDGVARVDDRLVILLDPSAVIGAAVVGTGEVQQAVAAPEVAVAA